MLRIHGRRGRWSRAALPGAALIAAASVATAQDAGTPAATEEPKKETATALEGAIGTIVVHEETIPYVLPGEIVVSAARGVPLRYAGGRDVIGPEVLQRYPDGNVATVLRRVPGVVVLPENGNDSRANFGLRGNDPRRSGLTTVLIDGVPASEAPYGNTDIDGLPISMERIHRIDVIRGGASIRWGPNSAGGVINLVTEPIPERQTARFGARFGSDGARSLWTTGGGTWDRFGALVTLVDKAGDGFRDNSEYSDSDASGKFRYRITDADTVNFSVSRFYELDAEQPGGLTQAQYDDDPDQSNRDGADFRYDVNTYRADYVHETDTGSFQLIGWYLEGYRGLYDFRPILQPFTVHRVQESDFRHGAIEARYSWRMRIAGMEHSFFTNVRYLDERNREFYWRQPLSGGPRNRPYDLDAIFNGEAWSVFAEDVIALRDDLDLALGGRRESVKMTSLSRDDTLPRVERGERYGELLPTASLTWEPWNDVAFYGSYQENFVTPQYETGFDPTSTFYRNVDPEHSKTKEVGTRVRAVKGLECAASYFETEFTDKIDFENLPSGEKIAVNSGEADSHGVELSVACDLGTWCEGLSGFSVYATATQQRSTISEGEFDGNDTPHSPHRLASWGVTYEHEAGVWARVGWSYTGKSHKERENYSEGSADGVQGPEPAYRLWDAAVGWRERPDGEGLALQMGVTNLFDEEYYRRFVSGIYPGAPREFFIAATYTIRW